MTQQGALGPNCKKGGQACDPCCGSTGRLDEPVVKRTTAGRGGRERRPLEEIEADIRGIEQDILRMLAEVTGSAPGDGTAGT